MKTESHYYPLFEKIVELTDTPLLDTDLQEICDVVMEIEELGKEHIKLRKKYSVLVKELEKLRAQFIKNNRHKLAGE